LSHEEPEKIMKDLFDELVTASGLSPIFAEKALLSALAKAGVPTRDISRGDVKRALPQIARTLGLYLDREEAERRIAMLSKLTL